jgi:tRNA threonylcarbamoyladenosine biosynthesis protein TsaB
MESRAMWTLAIDTSGLAGSISLFEEESCVAERSLQLGLQHGQSLIPAIHALLAEHRLSPRHCGQLAVSIGPGSFTGLRVGIVCAKTLAYAASSRIAGVNTLLAVAHNAPAEVNELRVIADAQRGDLFAARCVRAGDRFEMPEPIRIVAAGDWIAGLSPNDVVSGPGADVYIERLNAVCRVLAAPLRHPRAAIIGRLGLQAFAEGRLSDPWQLEPLYLRRSSAEEKWEARQQAQHS